MIPRDRTVPREILVNHVGFIPSGGKHCVVRRPRAQAFRVVRLWDGKVVLRGRLGGSGVELGPGREIDLSSVRAEGLYEVRIGGGGVGARDRAGGPDVVRAGGQISRVITVHARVYQPVLRTLFNYFPSQRCGDSRTGWNAPCHVRDARVAGTRRHVNVAGGWHQSCDLRKWTSGTVFGLLGLARLKLAGRPRWDAGEIGDEIKWGNLYFHRMVRRDGALMDFVVSPENWEPERTLYAGDAQPGAAWHAIIGQAMAAEVFARTDRAYARRCLGVAGRMWAYMNGPARSWGPYRPPFVPRYHEWGQDGYSQQFRGSALDLGGGLYAALTLFRATGKRSWLDEAASRATALAALHVPGDPARDLTAGCFRVSRSSAGITNTSYDGVAGPLGLAELAMVEPRKSGAAAWCRTVETAARRMALAARRNPWGLVPAHWYAVDPGGGRRAGSGFCRYFDDRWQGRTGSNGEYLGAALFLLRASRLLRNREYLRLACRQADWVMGCNPFDASAVEGVGRNQPERHVNTDEFFPPTPQIPGAVMTGLTGGADDEPVAFNMGVEAEYDMPPTSLLMWFLAELSES